MLAAALGERIDKGILGVERIVFGVQRGLMEIADARRAKWSHRCMGKRVGDGLASAGLSHALQQIYLGLSDSCSKRCRVSNFDHKLGRSPKYSLCLRVVADFVDRGLVFVFQELLHQVFFVLVVPVGEAGCCGWSGLLSRSGFDGGGLAEGELSEDVALLADGLVDELAHWVRLLPLFFFPGLVRQIQFPRRWLTPLLVFYLRLAFFLLDLFNDAHHSQFKAVLILGLRLVCFLRVGVLFENVGNWRFVCLDIKMLDPLRVLPSQCFAWIVLFLDVPPLFVFVRSRLRLELDVHALLPGVATLRPIHAGRHLMIPLVGSALPRWELVGEYLDEIFEHKPHGIMQIPDLPDDILRCFFGDVLMHLDVHVAVNEVVGIDLCVVVHFVLFELRHLIYRPLLQLEFIRTQRFLN